MKALITIMAVVGLAGCSARPAPRPSAYHVVAGSFVPDRGPDGNSIFLESPAGLILVDTGRHPAHRDRLLAHAQARRQPIVAVVNTHWHLDHSTNNADIRAAYPGAELYATTAIEGALTGFFPRSRGFAQRHLDSGQATPEQRTEILRAFQVMDHPEYLRPTRPVTESADRAIGGRRLRINVAHFAATEADLWIQDRSAGLVIAGDLVVAPVPFMDTACPEGWRRALDELAATEFTTLVPGHGEVMDKPQFLTWRTAFNNLLDCGVSSRDRQDCIEGWQRDAAIFIPAGDERRIAVMVGYYLDTRLRASPEERDRYCSPGT
ncbi:MAG TPA: MBL fold metallo-hydrolase [Allosphingosinicella sp.]|nr:MBL fold metallo-hydrolase [Allosphingosinicella sp.]